MRSLKLSKRIKYNGWVLVWALSGVFILFAIRYETTGYMREVKAKLDRVIELLEDGGALELYQETD